MSDALERGLRWVAPKIFIYGDYGGFPGGGRSLPDRRVHFQSIGLGRMPFIRSVALGQASVDHTLWVSTLEGYI